MNEEQSKEHAPLPGWSNDGYAWEKRIGEYKLRVRGKHTDHPWWGIYRVSVSPRGTEHTRYVAGYTFTRRVLDITVAMRHCEAAFNARVESGRITLFSRHVKDGAGLILALASCDVMETELKSVLALVAEQRNAIRKFLATLGPDKEEGE